MQEVANISHHELEVILARPSTLLLDVRERGEFYDHNIGGLNVPPHEINDFMAQLASYQHIVVACSNGMRSGIVLRLLLKKLPAVTFFHLEEGI